MTDNRSSYRVDSLNFEPETRSGATLAFDVLKEGTWDGLKQRVNEFKDKPVESLALQLGVPTAVGAGLAIMSRLPVGNRIAKGVGAVMMAGAAIDGLYRLGTAAGSAIDSAQNPENYYANKQAIANTLGAGLFDYAVVGFASYKGTQFLTERMMASTLGSGKPLSARLTGQAAVMDEYSRTNAVFEAAQKMSTDRHIAMPQYLHGVNSKEATVTMAARDSFLGKLYLNSKEAVVKINVRGNGPHAGAGSGFFVDSDGTIVTNYHVVRGARTIEINTADGQKYWARFLGRDKLADLAVLQVLNKGPDKRFSFLELGNAMGLKKGEGLISVGHPIGVPQEVLALGQLKGHALEFAPNRRSPIQIQVPGGTKNVLTASDLVTNLPIKGGYSGSPLLDSNGKVVGVLKSESGDISMATAVDHLYALLGQIRSRSPLNGWLEVRSYYDVRSPYAIPLVKIAQVREMSASDWGLASKIRGNRVVKPKVASEMFRID